MQRNELVTGVTSGILAASATAGALVGFGARLGTPVRAFNTIAAIFLGTSALDQMQFRAGITLFGALVHLVAMLALGVISAWLVAHLGVRPLVSAIVSAIVALIATLWLARVPGAGPAVLLPFGNIVLLHVVLTVALLIGMRFAPVSVQRGSSAHAS